MLNFPAGSVNFYIRELKRLLSIWSVKLTNPVKDGGNVAPPHTHTVREREREGERDYQSGMQKVKHPTNEQNRCHVRTLLLPVCLLLCVTVCWYASKCPIHFNVPVTQEADENMNQRPK